MVCQEDHVVSLGQEGFHLLKAVEPKACRLVPHDEWPHEVLAERVVVEGLPQGPVKGFELVRLAHVGGYVLQ